MDIETAVRQYLEAQTALFDVLADPAEAKRWVYVLDKIRQGDLEESRADLLDSMAEDALQQDLA
jgi:hypothetical protein